MRVFLVRPNSILRATTIPLGLGYVAAAARQAGHEVGLLDARLQRLRPEETARRVRAFAPDLVGVSAIHYEQQGAQELCRALRAAGFTGPIVLGGPLASTRGEEMVREELVSAAVVGEGERALVSYLASLESRSPAAIPGLICREGGEVRSLPAEVITPIDDLLPAWDLIAPEQYFRAKGRHTQNVLARSRRSLSMFSSRGCPFGCIYCHNVFGKRFRPRSAEAVLGEIEMLQRDYGIEELDFVDDSFNLDLDRAKRIAAGLIARGRKLHISFSNGLRADRMDEELVELLRRAGTYRINYAVETASPRLQQLIKKNLDLDQTARAIEWTARRGIFTLGYFMLGFPTETRAEVETTVAYALASRLHSAAFFYVTPFPNTELVRLYPLPERFRDSRPGMDYTAFSVNLSAVPDADLKRIYRRAYRKFHFHPVRMWRTFQVVPKNWNTLRSVAVVAALSLGDLPNF